MLGSGAALGSEGGASYLWLPGGSSAELTQDTMILVAHCPGMEGYDLTWKPTT